MDGTDDFHRQGLTRADSNGVGRRRYADDEARLAVVGRRTEPETAPLTYGEPVGSSVLANLRALKINDVTGSGPQPLLQEPAVSPLAMKQMS
jgi:hypothetical protein